MSKNLVGIILFQLVIILWAGSGCGDMQSISPSSLGSENDLFQTVKTDSLDSTIVLKRSLPGENTFEDIFIKNLFDKDRTFTEVEGETEIEPTATPTKTAVDLPNIVLVGTLTSDSSKLAFVKDMKAKDRKLRGKVVKYSEGDWIGDYLVSEIASNKVTLTRGEELAYLRLKPPENIKRKTRSGNRRSNVRGGSRTTGRTNTPSSGTRKTSSNRSNQKYESKTREEKEKMEKEQRMANQFNRSRPASSRTSRSRSGGTASRRSTDSRRSGRSGS